ncbi:MAG: deoxyribose-phosphate aldolase [Planctomycetota bacterium]|nr:MAG: deoxyribose-phosphate aldolase [Planctomycetota bacterium]
MAATTGSAAAVDPALVERVTRELEQLLAAGASPWAGELRGGPPCFGCGDRGRCVVVCSSAFRAVVDAGADRVSTAPGLTSAPEDLAHRIDHTLLKQDATAEQIQTLCEEAVRFGFASVCVNPFWVPVCAELLAGSCVKVCTVIGFPLGANSPVIKAAEARQAVCDGANELDMVINVGALKSGLHGVVQRDIEGVVEAAGPDVIVKVILETGALTDEEKVVACELAVAAGADYVKTSTGFGPGGATAADIALMRRIVGPRLGVKASGGIRDKKKALLMVRAGADRIGASASVKIVRGEDAGAGSY